MEHNVSRPLCLLVNPHICLGTFNNDISNHIFDRCARPLMKNNFNKKNRKIALSQSDWQ